jgi:hypothetical protein
LQAELLAAYVGEVGGVARPVQVVSWSSAAKPVGWQREERLAERCAGDQAGRRVVGPGRFATRAPELAGGHDVDVPY